jgi:amino acid transporter
MGQVLGEAGLLGVFIGLSVGALMMGLVGLCYAEIGAHFPVAGGEVAYEIAQPLLHPVRSR